MPSLSRRINNRYEILSELGRGAMGTVYQARDPVLERDVALKMMSEALLVEDEMRERFYREAKSAANLRHPNIVTIYDLGEVEGEGIPFIAMELLDGHPLSQVLEEGRLRGLEEKVGVVVQICRGLDYAHKQGVIHRDIKPGNVQLLPDGSVKLLDFGIALREGSTVMTKTGLVMGTPTYMAPEQIAGSSVDHRADMWAVGIILYELLSGRRPFESETIPALIYRIVHQPPPPLDAQAQGLPEDLVAVVSRVLNKEPDARFQDLAEMAGALQAALGAPLSAGVMPPEARERRYARNFELARTLLSRGQLARALDAARRAQALEPSRAEIRSLIAEVEARLRAETDKPTLALPVAEEIQPVRDQVDVEKWMDEARLALAGGNRTEALRIVEDVLTVDPSCRPALELREILDKPAAPGRARTGRHRTYSGTEIRLRPAPSFRKLEVFGERQGIQVIAIAPHEDLAAVGGVDGSIRLWDLGTRSKVTTFRSDMHRRAGYEGLVTSLVFSGDGAFLASGHVDGAIHVWSLDTGEELKVRLGHDTSVGAIAFSPDGSQLASGGLDFALKLWDMDALRAGEGRRRLIRQPSGVSSLGYAGDGTLIITGHTNRILRVLDVATGRLTATLRGHQSAVSYLAVGPDGNLIASGGRDNTVRLFDVQHRRPLGVLAGHKKAVSSIGFFPDGHQVASVAMEENLIVWDLWQKAPSATLWGDAGENFVSVQVFEGGRKMACALADGRIRLWGST
ncbi:MAG: WD40 repeat domain-containing serine/threonine protein kinase [Acidobacteriota bacterium]